MKKIFATLMKKKVLPLAALALLLALPALCAAEGPVLLIELPEDAQLIEDVDFGDGDFVQTYQLQQGATVQLLRYGTFDMTLAELVESDWPGAQDVTPMDIVSVGAYPAEGARFTWAGDGEAVSAALLLVHADGRTLILQIIVPAAQDADAVIAPLLSTLDAMGEAEEPEVG